MSEFSRDVDEVAAEVDKMLGGSLADRLIAAAMPDIDELFHNEFREPFARIQRSDHFEIHPMKSRDFRLWLQGIGYKELGRAINGEATKTAIDTLSAQAILDCTPNAGQF